MSAPFLDTNILLRHLLNDHPVQSPACFALIQAIEQGKISVWTSDLVIAEVVFVLSSKATYNLSREAIRNRLLPLLSLPGIKLSRHSARRNDDACPATWWGGWPRCSAAPLEWPKSS